jgi:hypothetical protein
MAITYQKKRAVMEGTCTVEEAEGLLQWLIKHPGREVDLRRAQYFHMAVLQTLMALKPVIVGEPQDAFLAAHVLPHLRPPRRA